MKSAGNALNDIARNKTVYSFFLDRYITGKTVILTNRTDESLLGGITLRYGGVQLDDSIRSRLDKLRRSLSDMIV